MKVAIITPYYKESLDLLRQCHDSVMTQTASCDHFMVADGYANRELDSWNVRHLSLPSGHADVGNMPRVLGSLSAFHCGYDAIAFLDADNWYRDDHVARMIDLHRATGAVVCTSERSMHRPDGSFMFVDDKSDGRTHVDTNCYFLARAAAPVVAGWALMPRELAAISDTIYLHSLKRARFPRAHLPEATVCYRTTWASDFERMAEAMPPGVKTSAFTDEPHRWFKSLPAARRRELRRAVGWPAPLPERALRRLKRTLSGLPVGSAATLRVEGRSS